MSITIQFPSPALWHQILSGPPVGKDQGTRNPIGGFSEMVHAQLAKQSAIAGLQPPQYQQVPRPPSIQRAPEKEGRDKDRNPRGQQRRGANPEGRPDGRHDGASQQPVWA